MALSIGGRSNCDRGGVNVQYAAIAEKYVVAMCVGPYVFHVKGMSSPNMIIIMNRY